MEENNNSWWIWILIIAVVWSLFFHKQKYEGMTAEEWYNENSSTQETLQNYKDALEEANNNIEEANSNIEDAQGMAWESYDDMGYTLEDLNTVDTVSEPY